MKSANVPLDSSRAEGRGVLWVGDFLGRSPLFEPLAEAGAWLESCASFPSPEEIDAALAERAGIRFERQAPVPRRRRVGPRDPASMYDARIAAGAVPTRPGSWHDLMNALVWATFPRAKRALHARQYRLVRPAAPGESARRPRELDALALVDEGGVLVTSRERLASETEKAVELAIAGGEATAVVFGHAIFEGIVLGRPLPLASAMVFVGGPLDDALAARIEQIHDPKDLLRLRLQGLEADA